MLDSRTRDGLRVFHPNGTIHFGANIVGHTVHVAPNGSVLVRYGSQVTSFHPNGTHAAMFETRVPDGVGGTSSLGGALRLLPGGNMAVSQTTSQFAVFHPNGTYAFSFGQYGRYYGELRETGHAAVGPGGKLFVASGNNRIEVFHPNGTYDSVIRVDTRDKTFIDVGPSGEIVFGRELYCHVHYPNDTRAFYLTRNSYSDTCVFGPTGMVVVSEPDRGGGGIGIFHGVGSDVRPPPSFVVPPAPPAYVPPAPPAYVPPAPPGPFVTGSRFAFEIGSYGSGPGEFRWPDNVAFGPGGTIAVADWGNNRVNVFHPNGTFAHAFGSSGHSPGEFNRPFGIAFGPNGLLAVTDVGNHRVQFFYLE